DFRSIRDYLIQGNDEFFILKDFNSYIDAHEEIYARYSDRAGWLRSVAMNIANSGRFSSDRTIDEYAAEIWNIAPCKVQ
ncbi:MAG: glycogen/starch/alpha-glucan phosphorylase, partial [Selenomonadaceae bacterium]|nr:glycogen/starch/alpha-glucan phosphorylase [Selenomonadaceae bacterium]